MLDIFIVLVCPFQYVKMVFNKLKDLLYIVSGMNVFNQLNYFSIN